MKATEFQIGDWILHLGEKAQIAGIRADNSINSPYIRTNLHDFWYELGHEGIEPIPLTAKILEANGWEKKDNDGKPLWSLEFNRYLLTFEVVNGGCPILTIEDVTDSDERHTVMVLKDEIYEVHELQHAMRLLDIDKEIVIE